ncbi:A1 cistron-splicing factor [Phytophthora palmivora]|uniref:A1 cistron-splicing factor n=1 Tax=Phytophthora palmivora TaxID=4796 RepID=A0A2P4YDQ9_9STRA|nr:A1 cistron-splicing factor [Phytophthora palmivora]
MGSATHPLISSLECSTALHLTVLQWVASSCVWMSRRPPSATEFGVDYEVFRTGPKFQGVKFLPLGIHFVLFRSREQEHGIRQGFFIHVERHAQVIVREWSLEKEELGPPRPGLNVDNLERAVLSFQLDSGLGPYPKQHWKTWQRLSNFISAEVLQHCGVEFGAILLPGDAIEDAATSTKTQDGVIPYFPDLPRTVRFTALQKTRTDLSAEARTVYHFDRSERLEELIETEFGGKWKELIGELQLSFLVFLQLSSLAALEQWKQFIALLCSCERALASHVPLFLAFIKLFRTQLEQIPQDFFQDETTSENFLSPCLSSLLELIEADDAPRELREKAFHFRQLLASRFHWDFHEFAPVVMTPQHVSSTPGGRGYGNGGAPRGNPHHLEYRPKGSQHETPTHPQMTPPGADGMDVNAPVFKQGGGFNLQHVHGEAL